jgi:hypothetical protein
MANETILLSALVSRLIFSKADLYVHQVTVGKGKTIVV